MLRTLCLFACLCMCGLSVGWELQGLSSFTVPVLMWSDKQVFTKSQVTDTITTEDMDFALQSIIHKNTNKESKLDNFINNAAAAPEVVVLFVEPELRTDQIPYIASAYASAPGGSFSHLKDAISNAQSSLTMPYATVSEVTLLDETLRDIIDEAAGHVFMASVGGSSLFSHLRQHSGVTTVEVGSLLDTLASKNAFNNGEVDVVVVCFDRTTSAYNLHDSIIGDFMEGINAKGDYVAVYTANMPAAARLVWTFEEHSRAEFERVVSMYMDDPSGNNSNSSNNTNNGTSGNHTHHKRINYFPGAFIEALLISAILLTMLFTGACAIFSLQTPDRWEPPKGLKRD